MMRREQLKNVIQINPARDNIPETLRYIASQIEREDRPKTQNITMIVTEEDGFDICHIGSGSVETAIVNMNIGINMLTTKLLGG